MRKVRNFNVPEYTELKEYDPELFVRFRNYVEETRQHGTNLIDLTWVAKFFLEWERTRRPMVREAEKIRKIKERKR